MLSIVWKWFCTIGQLMIIAMIIIEIVCIIRDKEFKFSKKFEEKHPILTISIYIAVVIWMAIGLASAILDMDVHMNVCITFR